MKASVASRIAGSIACVLLLSHCAQEPLRTPVPVAPPLPDAQEIELGRAAHQVVLREHAPLDHAPLQAYVNAIGMRLAAHSARPALPWQFTVMDSAEVNAYSLPGGYVYVARGLLAHLNSEAELAAVLAHEIGHIDARHGLRRQADAPAPALGSVLAPEGEQPPGASLAKTLAAAWATGYGREAELEAHRRAAQLLAAAGYRPQAVVDVATALKNQAAAAQAAAARFGAPHHATFDGHPNDRTLTQFIAQASRSVTDPRDGRDEYLGKLDGLIYGDSPEQGTLRENRLLHERFGFSVQFPPGWQVQNRADRVVALHPDGDAMVELQPGPKRGKPLDTLQRGVKLDAGARYDSGELAGYPAAFAAGAQGGKPAVVAAVVFNDAQYLLAGMTRDKAAYERERAVLRATINSFRGLTAAERRALKGRTLQTVVVEPGQTLADIAKQSPLGDDAETHLRLINALYPEGEPEAGQSLKIVR